MTWHSMYVGRPDSFDWESPNDVNLPGPLTKPFPPEFGYHGAIIDWAKRNNVYHAKTDFDGWVARVSKAQLLAFVDACASSSRTPERWSTVRDEIQTLPDDGEYGLVSECY